VEIRHRRVQRKEAVERQRWRLAVRGQRFLAAQFNPIRVSDRRRNGEPIERAAQYDRQKSRVAAFRPRDAGHRRPGEHHSGAEQQLTPCWGMEGSRHHHLR